MLETLKLAGRNAIALKGKAFDRLPLGRPWGGRSGRMANGLMIGAPLAALLVIAGCSWFSDDSTSEPEAAKPAASQTNAKPPEPGEGEAMNAPGNTAGTTNGAATVTSNETASSAGTIPDINSVPNEAPKPSIDLTETPNGLGSDTANAQHTDETLTMPNETAERPVPPGQENQAASVQATAPETPATPPAVAPEAATPPAEVAAAPAPAPAPAAQVALAGTPEAGAKPFEPSGPLHLAPGSLNRNAPAQPTAIAQAAPAPAPEATALAPTPAPEATQMAAAPSISATPMPSAEPTMPAAAPTMPAPSGDAVSVDYSVLNGLQAGSNGAMPMAPMNNNGAPMSTNNGAAQVAGVGQAVGYVYFGNDSASLSEQDRQVLQEVVQLQHIQGGVLRIVGHASQRTGNLDAMAQNRVNQQVSLQRATVVAQALVGMGVQPLLVQVAAAGDSQTLYSESTPAGEAGNRRAEVYLSQN
jgi:outer membrane protein OmpA-like peptidoglycan-associated protein